MSSNKRIKKTYQCTECDKSFSGASGLWYHNKHVHNAITQLRPRNNPDLIQSRVSKEPKLKKRRYQPESDTNFLSTIIKYPKSDDVNPFSIEWEGNPDGLMKIVECYHRSTSSVMLKDY
jgi:hypothetical protein